MNDAIFLLQDTNLIHAQASDLVSVTQSSGYIKAGNKNTREDFAIPGNWNAIVTKMNVHCLLGLGFMLGAFDAPAFRARNLVGDDAGEGINSVGRHLVDEDVQNGAEINA